MKNLYSLIFSKIAQCFGSANNHAGAGPDHGAHQCGLYSVLCDQHDTDHRMR